MRIALIINTSWNIYNFRYGLIKSLLEEGHEIIAIAPKDDYSEKLIELGCEFYPVNMDSRGVNPFKDFLLIVELLRIYSKSKPDILLHFTVKPNIFGTIAGSILRIPTINNVCGLGTAFLERGFITTIVSQLYKFSFSFSDKVFFQNYEDCRLFTSNNLVNNQKVEVLPGSGIDLAKFKPMSKKGKDKFTFLMIGRIIREKGIIEYIEAIKKINKTNKKPLNFQILGEMDPDHRRGLQTEDLKQWLNIKNIDYLGTVNDVRETINNADCIVLPSYREGTPRTLLEAAAMAKPIITTDTAGCNNVVQDGYNGLLCKPKNSDDLAEKMFSMINKTEQAREEMGKNGRAKIELEFDEKLVIEKYKLAINNLFL